MAFILKSKDKPSPKVAAKDAAGIYSGTQLTSRLLPRRIVPAHASALLKWKGFQKLMRAFKEL